MAEKTDVNIEYQCKESVAFDLMKTISFYEKTEKDRAYFLTLYTQCYKAVTGCSLKNTLTAD
jgi:hypothetical protein